MRIEPDAVAQAGSCFFHCGGKAFKVRHVNFFPFRIIRNGAGKPADGNQAEQLRVAGLEMENRHGVLRAIANEQRFARFVERQRVGLCAEQVRRVLPRANGLDDLVRARVNHAQRIAARVGDHQPPAIRRQRQCASVQTGENFADRERCRLGSVLSEVLAGRMPALPEFKSITETEPSLAMERASTRTRMPSPAGPIRLSASGRRPPPVAHVDFMAGQHDVKRRDADVPGPQNVSGRGIQFEEAVGKIARDIKFFAVRRNGDAGGNFRLAQRCVGGRQRKGIQRCDFVSPGQRRKP